MKMKITLLLRGLFFSIVFIGANQEGWGQTPYTMSSGNYLQTFDNIVNTTEWPNGMVTGTHPEWKGLATNAAGTIPDGVKLTAATTSFVTSTTGGIQRGSAQSPVTANIVFLSTGSGDNTTSTAVDLHLNFTDRNAGTLSYSWATVNNSTGNRSGSLRIYTSIDGTTFTELSAATVLNSVNNVAGSGTISAINLPSSFNKVADATLRFYYHNGTGGTTGSRPKISVDNVAVTCAAPLWTSNPLATNVSYDNFTAKVNLNIPGKAYFVVLPSGATAPTSVQIKAGKDAADIDLAANLKGTINCSSASTDYTSLVSGLVASTIYDVYFIAEDGATIPNLQASPQLLSVTTTAVLPAITLTGSVNFSNIVVNTTSSEQSYQVSGANLTNDIIINAPTDYQISTTSGSGFLSTITLSQIAGVVSNTTVYVRFHPLTVGTYVDQITHTSIGATPRDQVINSTSIAPANPSSFVASSSAYNQIDLAWVLNAQNHNVLLAYNTTNSFGTPSGTYNASDAIAGGGTVLSVGNLTSFNHSGLIANTQYYYKIWSFDAFHIYSDGAMANATTSNLAAPVANAASSITSNSFSANWSASTDALDYRIDVSEFSTFSILGTNLIEDFALCTGGTHTTPSSTDIGTLLDTKLHSTGWSGVRIYEAGGEIKFGTSSLQGTLTTPTENLSLNSGNSTLKFDLIQFGTDAAIIQVLHAPDGVNFVQVGSDISATSGYVAQTISINGGTSSSKIRIQGKNATNCRFYIDNFILERYIPSYVSGYQDLTVSATSQAVTGLNAGKTYYFRARAHNATSTSANSNVQNVTTNVVWNGAVSADWAAAGNWDDNVIPTSTDKVVINSVANQPIIDANVSVAGLTINNTAILTLNSGKQLSVTGTTTLNGGENLVIKSDINGTGSFIDHGIAGTGTAKVERYATMDRTYYFSSAVSGAFTNSIGGIGRIKKFDAAAPSPAWVELNIDGTTALGAGVGYAVKYITPNTPSINFAGTLNTGDISPALSFDATAGYVWNLVGNPYPSAIDWDAASPSWTKNNINNAFYIRTGPSTIVAYIGNVSPAGVGVGTLGSSKYIAAGQAFWVRADGAAPVLTFKNLARVHNTVSMRKVKQTNILRVFVDAKDYSDEAVFAMNEISTNNFDASDAYKMFSNGNYPEIYSLVENKELVINQFSATNMPQQLGLGLKSKLVETYTIRVNLDEFADYAGPIYLKDNLLGKNVDLRTNPSYSFTSTVGSANDRFVIEFTNSLTGIKDVKSAETSVYAYQNQIYVRFAQPTFAQIEVIDLMGKVVKSATINSSENNIPTGNLKGIFMVRVKSNSGISTDKVFIQ